MKIEINPVYRHLTDFIYSVPYLFDSIGEIIHDGRNRLRRCNIYGYELVIKRFKKPHLINRFVYGSIRDSKAERSYEYAFKLLEKNINTPIPVAYIEVYSFGLRDSYYLSLYTSIKREMREFCDLESVDNNRFILEAFGKFTANLHNKGVLHIDYSPGNILFDTVHGRPVFTLVDINRMKFVNVSEEMGYKNLQRLWLHDEPFRVIARSYAKERGFDEDKAEELILKYKNRYMATRY